MDLNFKELIVLAESLLSGIHFDYLIPESDIKDFNDPLTRNDIDLRFDKVVLLKKVLDEILKHRPSPF